MSKEVNVEELKERVEDVIASVDAGETVEIVRDGRRIATLTPELTVVQRGRKYPFRDLEPGRPLSKPLDIDVVELLSQDREDRF